MWMDAKLACLWAPLVALIVAASGDIYMKVGGEVRFKPDRELSSGNTITWKFKSSDGSVIRVIEFDQGQGQDAIPPNDRFKSNAEGDKSTGELLLRDLTQVHSGLYYFEINGKEQEQKFKLTVMNAVPKPQLKKKVSNESDVVYLVCEYDAIINWTCSNTENPVVSLLKESRNGKFFTVTRSGNPDTCCSCTLKNIVSEETSDPLCRKDLFRADPTALSSGPPGKLPIASLSLHLYTTAVMFAVIDARFRQ